jgi:hypothetical protein
MQVVSEDPESQMGTGDDGNEDNRVGDVIAESVEASVKAMFTLMSAPLLAYAECLKIIGNSIAKAGEKVDIDDT